MRETIGWIGHMDALRQRYDEGDIIYVTGNDTYKLAVGHMKEPRIWRWGGNGANSLFEEMIAGSEKFKSRLLKKVIEKFGFEIIREDLIRGGHKTCRAAYEENIERQANKAANWQKLIKAGISRGISHELVKRIHENDGMDLLVGGVSNEYSPVEKWLDSKWNGKGKTWIHWSRKHIRRITRCNSREEILKVFEGGKFFDDITAAFMMDEFGKLKAEAEKHD